jgi:hypothetical protein
MPADGMQLPFARTEDSALPFPMQLVTEYTASYRPGRKKNAPIARGYRTLWRSFALSFNLSPERGRPAPIARPERHYLPFMRHNETLS